MCGIIAYIGSRQASPILVAGLKRLEYRGYDSAGVGLVVIGEDGSATLSAVKKSGKVVNLESALAAAPISSTLGIAHTRWATHGPATDVNAHPHMSTDNDVAVVHNGVIDNYGPLKKLLIGEGYEFRSDTDTELFAHLVADQRAKNRSLPLDAVVRLALSLVSGAFGVCFIFKDQPDLLIGARRGSPLLLAVGEGEYFLASDPCAILEHTKAVHYLADNEMVVISRKEGYKVMTTDVVSPALRAAPTIRQLSLTLDSIDKGGYPHLMLKEIMEQPDVLETCLRGRVNAETGDVRLGGLIGEPIKHLAAARRIIIVACGTSFNAGLVGEYAIEKLARVPVEVEFASEFRYRDPILFKEDVLIAISQSGETADTLEAVRVAKAAGAMTLGLVNVVGSSIARETGAGAYLRVGPEIGVASTKAFTGQVLTLVSLALMIGRERGVIAHADMLRYTAAIQAIPAQVASVLAQAAEVERISLAYKTVPSCLFLGRGFNYPVALEGALKLKEISYIHAEGYAAAEIKHGPIALIDREMPVIVIAPKSDSTYGKIRSNIEAVRARGARCVIVTEEGNHELDACAEAVIYIPHTEEFLGPLLTVVPLQLIAYHVACHRGLDVDQPRNLAKSVTVE